MASYGLLLIYSGFAFDMTKKHIGFNPIQKGDGRYFWSVGNSYGEVRHEGDRLTLSVEGGELELCSFGLREGAEAVCVSVDGVNIPFEQSGDVVFFENTRVGSTLTVQTV